MSKNAPAPLRDAAAGSGPPAIEVTGLTRRFGVGERVVRAVDGVDLRIDTGEIVALLGTNGAGKTTLLDTVLGLSAPDDGAVRVLGQNPMQAVNGGRISAVLQTGGLLADITVAETISVIASFHGATARIAEVMDRADLTEIAKRRVVKCSGGEQQRIKFALALLPDPDVLILDEPTAGMDVNARRRFWDAMRQDASAGRTIVFATHYLEEAEQFARRTVVMHRGRILADGDTAELRSSLGGRTVSATLPETRDGAGAEAILAELRVDFPDIAVEGHRIAVRTPDSDALAARLLRLGAHDLEIAAPTLESTFTSLTES